MPGFGAFAFKEIDDLAVERGIEDGLAATLADKDRDGNAPDALAADAPVGAAGDHVCNALLAPGRIPGDLIDLFDAELTEGGLGTVCSFDRGFKADEPLLRSAEDDWVVAAPAVGIGMLK